MRENKKDTTNQIIAAFTAGIILGVLVPVAVIDDCDEFRIWGTDKVFKRVYIKADVSPNES